MTNSTKSVENACHNQVSDKCDIIKESIMSLSNGLSHTTDMKFEHQNIKAIKNTGHILLGQQLYGLIIKKVLYSKRSFFLTAAQLLMPFLVLNFTLISMNASSQMNKSPPLHMSLSQFNNPQVTYFFDPTTSQNLANKYEDTLKHIIVNDANINAIGSIEPTQILSEIITKPVTVFNYNFMISAVLTGDGAGNYTMVGMFNNQAYHTPAITLKYLDETYIRYKYNQLNYSITVTNYPLPLTAAENGKLSFNNVQIKFQTMQGLILGMSLLVSSFSVLSVKERVTNGKHLQRLSGVRISIYWLSYFLTDYLVYLISSLLIVLTFVLYKEEGLYQARQPWFLILGMIVHGFAILPCVYILSFIFAAPATAYARLCLLLTVAGIAAILSDQITTIPDLDLKDKNEVLKPIFSLFVPVFTMSKVVSNLIDNYQNNKVCNIDNLEEQCEQDNVSSLILSCCKGNIMTIHVK